jgi:hypothetical protein
MIIHLDQCRSAFSQAADEIAAVRILIGSKDRAQLGQQSMVFFVMDSNMTALERAFRLAESGKVTSMEELRKALASEGYSTAQLTGGALNAQLRDLIQKAKG